ncbi:related to tol protein [Fusarium fujikuroi]|nr:related to tol protein [Fusarium fujikuroi]SCO15101.1 related to tol protein [Fusarium fujikuroi]SCO57218.1 related to tol protein [Fusarium fujikuroi]
MIASRHTTDESLCSRCKSLDLDDILSGRWTNVQCREPVAFFGKRSTILHDEDCPLCQALLSIAAGDHDTGPLRRDENFGMFAIPSQLAYRGAKQTIPFDVNLGDRVLERAKDQKDSMWLVVRIQRGPMDGPFWYNNLPRSAHYFGCLANLSDTLNGVGQRVRLINPAKADFEAIKRWLTHCMEQHGTLCNPDSESRSLPVSIAIINCTTRDLEPLPAGAKFAALSYVWGERTSTTESYPSMTSLPQTIEDAITVTAEKREQIQMMHKIYRQADLTIITAAGDSSCYGLPGISTPRARAPSVDLCVRNHHLVSTGRSAKEAIRGTAWASRAWTYQEGLVSRRKLIFTDEQVYLHCMEREFRETIEQDLDLLAQADVSDLSDPFRCSILHLIPGNAGTEGVYSLTGDFSERRITYPSDRLNAFLGILNLFQDAFPESFRHIWGQPIPYSTDMSVGDVVVSALNWHIVGLAQRRPDFPSWSWVGWKGKAYPSANSVYKEDITASLLLKDGTVIDDAEMLRNLDTFQSLSASLSKYILIQAQTVHVKIRRKEGDHWNLRNMWKLTLVKGGTERHGITYHDGFSITPEYEAGDSIYEDLEAGHTWLGIVFLNSDMVLVLKDMGDYYERFGCIDVDFSVPDLELGDYLLGHRLIRLG